MMWSSETSLAKADSAGPGTMARPSLPKRTKTSSSIQVYCSALENHRRGPPETAQVRFQFVVAGAQNRSGAGRADEQRHAIRLLVIQGGQ